MHANQQLPAAQVALAFVRAGHGEHRVPQLVAAVSSAQLVPHAWKPALHANPHTDALQVARPLVGTGHARSQAPQVVAALRSVSQPLVALASQFANPALHAIPHEPAAQVARPFAGVAHARLQTPQCVTVVRVSTSQPLLASPSQSAKPVVQANPQLAALHVDVAFARTGQGEQSVPQVSTAVSGAQVVPHT